MAIEPISGVAIRPPVPAVKRVSRRAASDKAKAADERPARRNRRGAPPGMGDNLDITV